MPEEQQILDVKLPVAGSRVPARLPGGVPLPATGREVAQFVAMRAAACVGADYSNLALLAVGQRSLRMFHGPFLSPELVVVPVLQPYEVEFAEILADTIAAGVEATASIPLHREDGSLVGVIGFAWTKPTSFDAKLES